jgi:hypothetical protein
MDRQAAQLRPLGQMLRVRPSGAAVSGKKMGGSDVYLEKYGQF